jgi:hypothetical protein
MRAFLHEQEMIRKALNRTQNHLDPYDLNPKAKANPIAKSTLMFVNAHAHFENSGAQSKKGPREVN